MGNDPPGYLTRMLHPRTGRHGPLPDGIIAVGRSVAGPSGVTLYRVLTRKRAADGTRWVALDGGMADNVRPAMYGAAYTVAAAGR